MNLVNTPDATGHPPRWRPSRRPTMVERLAEYARLVELGWSVPRIAFELGVSERTVERYRARIVAGETPGFTPAESAYWLARDHSYGHPGEATPWLRGMLEAGAQITGPDGEPVAHRPRCRFDSRPWLREGAEFADKTARAPGTRCRAVWPDGRTAAPPVAWERG